MATTNSTENKSLESPAAENKALEAQPEPNRNGNVRVHFAHWVDKDRIPGVDKDYKPGDEASVPANTAYQLVADGVARYASK